MAGFLKFSLLWKIILIFWITTFFTIVANIYITREIVLNEAKLTELRQQTRNLASEAVSVWEGKGGRALKLWYRQTARENGLRVLLLDGEGKVLGQRSKDRKHHHDGGFEERFLKAADQHVVSPLGKNYTLRLKPSPYLRKHFGAPEQLHAYRLGATFLIILLGSLALARSVARPVNTLRGASEQIAQGDFDVRVVPKVGRRRDELGELANAFDHMAEKIAQLMADQRRLFCDISHEIRTPLTRQKIAIELARDAEDAGPMLDKLEAQNEAIEKLVDDLLTLMRLEDGVTPAQTELVDLQSLIEQLVEEAELERGRKNVTIRTEMEPEMLARGVPDLLARALQNVLLNALKYSPEGGTISIAGGKALDALDISIRDEGPGIAPSELKAVLEPFFREDKSRQSGTGGHGLGLSIVNKIMQQHNGNIELKNLPQGGLEARLRFPSSAH